MSDAQDLELEDWHTFLGSWATEAIHPMLPGAEIRGETTFEWLDGRRFMINARITITPRSRTRSRSSG